MTLAEMILAGWTVRQIAAALGISHGAAHKQAKKLGGTKPPPDWRSRTRAARPGPPAQCAASSWNFAQHDLTGRLPKQSRWDWSPPSAHVPSASSAADCAALGSAVKSF